MRLNRRLWVLQLDTYGRQSACNQIKKCGQDDRQHKRLLKKYKKNLPQDQRSPDSCIQNAYFTDSWIADITLVTSQ